MRNWIFCLKIAFFTANASAQDTTLIRISTKTDALEQPTTEANHPFGAKAPARWMVNMSVSPNNNFVFFDNKNTLSLALGTEFKLNTAFSVGVNYTYGQQPFSIPNSDLKFHHITLEQRWYPQMARLENHGSAANNFSGTYWGLRTGISISQTRPALDRLHLFQLEIRYGIQQRLRKNGLFDYSTGITLSHSPPSPDYSSRSNNTIQLNQQLRLGLAVFEKQDKTNYSGTNFGILPVLDEPQHLFKLNTLDLIRVFYQKNPVPGAGIAFKPNVAIEQKIDSSSFSVEAEVDIDLFSAQEQTTSNLFSDLGYQFSGAAGLRWYYNQAKRIAAGRSGYHLWGPFIALRAVYSYGEGWTQSGQKSAQKYTTQSQTVHALWGYQLRIVQRSYAAFRIGPGLFKQTIDTSPDNQGWKFDLFSDLKVGFAF